MANYKRVFENGYSYFITIVTYHRKPILIENIGLLRESFAYSKQRFDYRIDEIVILPDHLHMIITPKNAVEYPKIIASIKAYFSRYMKVDTYETLRQSKCRYEKRYKPVWQRCYYEHTIRNESDWQEKVMYMWNNPVKHGLVDDILSWKYSSFVKRSL